MFFAGDYLRGRRVKPPIKNNIKKKRETFRVEDHPYNFVSSFSDPSMFTARVDYNEEPPMKLERKNK